ncbi:uncharacterized protein LOC133182761 [Saccostrea echinata]|uniref:uncharacterized protein LOC133182761 n=1 Tax=Saccostrea echinata TaxID=191078 RepID=UPI002A810C28|nr:uncharacterized protein LOC133182761 [Saccostrea echinata]
MIISFIAVLILGSVLADKIEVTNQRLISRKPEFHNEKNATSTKDNNASNFKHPPSHLNKDPPSTKYHFFRPHMKGEKLSQWSQDPNEPNVFHAPLATMLTQLLRTGKFDVIASFVRLELVRKGGKGRPHQRPLMPPPDQLLYNYYPNPLPLSFQPKQLTKDPVQMPHGAFVKPLPQITGAQSLPQVQVAQLLPKVSASDATYSFIVPEISEQRSPIVQKWWSPVSTKSVGKPQFMTNSVSVVSSNISRRPAPVPFETMYQQYQKMQGESKNTEKSYTQLSKLYEILNALKTIKSDSGAKVLQN